MSGSSGMTTLKEVLRAKSDRRPRLVTIDLRASALEAVVRMKRYDVGALLVLGAHGRLLGLVTERDVLHEVVANGAEPSDVRVGEVMEPDAPRAVLETTVDEARELFKEALVRHLPVIDGAGAVVGVVSIGDVNAHCLESQAVAIDALETYLYRAW